MLYSATMADPVETIYLSPRRTYLIRCPQCRERQEFHVSEIPHTREPYQYKCTCGTVSLVRLISFRCAPRKDVHLSAVLVRQTVNGYVRIPGVVENLSVKGVRIRIEAIPDFRDEAVKILMIIPAKIRRALDTPCKVRRALPSQAHIRLALEFQGLTTDQEQAIEEYLGTV